MSSKEFGNSFPLAKSLEPYGILRTGGDIETRMIVLKKAKSSILDSDTLRRKEIEAWPS